MLRDAIHKVKRVKTISYMSAYLTAEIYKAKSSYLWSGEHKRQQPSEEDEPRAFLRRIEALHRIPHRDESINTDQHEYEGTKVEAEHL